MEHLDHTEPDIIRGHMKQWIKHQLLTEYQLTVSPSGDEALDFMFRHSFGFFLANDKIAKGPHDIWTSEGPAFREFRTFLQDLLVPRLAAEIKAKTKGSATKSGPVAVVEGALAAFKNKSIKDRCTPLLIAMAAAQEGGAQQVMAVTTAACGEFSDEHRVES